MIEVDPHSECPKTGFTLFEIALTLFVVAFGVVGILALFPVGLTAGRDAVDDSRVSILAESILSDLRMEMAYNFNPTTTSYYYKVNNTNVVANQSAVLVFDETGNSPIGTFQLTVTNIPSTSSELAEATLDCWPGIQRIRKLTFYTRFLNVKGDS